MFRITLSKARLPSSSFSTSMLSKRLSSSSSPKDHLLPSTRFLHSTRPASSSSSPTIQTTNTTTTISQTTTEDLPIYSPNGPSSIHSFPSPPTPSEPIFLGPNYTHSEAMSVSPTLTTEQRYDYLSVLRTSVAQGGGRIQMMFDGEGATAGGEGEEVGCQIVLDGVGIIGESRGYGRGEAMGLAAEDACLKLGLA